MALDRDVLEALVGFIEEDRETFVPARLSILVYLFFTKRVQFTKLQQKLNLTSGNLSSHLRKLQELGLIKVSKSFVDLKPTTFVTITREGIEKVRDQILKMKELVSAAIEHGIEGTSAKGDE